MTSSFRTIGVAAAASICLTLAVRPRVAAAGRAADDIADAAAFTAVIDRYCVGCHNARQPTANLALDTFDANHAGANAEQWEKVLRKLTMGMMPPVGRPRPDPATYR